MKTQKKKVALYIRVSTKDKQDTDNQRLQLEQFAEKENWEVVKIYIDKQTGKNSDRPAFKKLFLEAYQKQFDIVLFWALDRFSREGVTETLQHLKTLENYNIGIVSYTEPYINSLGIFREAFISFLATISKQEGIRITERITAGMQRAKKEGKQTSRPPIEQSIIDKIQKKQLHGVSISQTARDLKISLPTVRKYRLKQ